MATVALRPRDDPPTPGLEPDIVRLARAGALDRTMTAGEFHNLFKTGVLRRGDHVELMSGRIVIKGMTRNDPHEIVKSRLHEWLVLNKPRALAVASEPMLNLPTGDVVEPDLVIFPRYIRPTQLLAVEIALLIEIADTSLPYDMTSKLASYARSGIAHYWVFDVNRLLLLTHADPEGEGYRALHIHGFADAIQVPVADMPTLRIVDLDLPSDLRW